MWRQKETQEIPSNVPSLSIPKVSNINEAGETISAGYTVVGKKNSNAELSTPSESLYWYCGDFTPMSDLSRDLSSCYTEDFEEYLAQFEHELSCASRRYADIREKVDYTQSQKLAITPETPRTTSVSPAPTEALSYVGEEKSASVIPATVTNEPFTESSAVEDLTAICFQELKNFKVGSDLDTPPESLKSSFGSNFPTPKSTPRKKTPTHDTTNENIAPEIIENDPPQPPSGELVEVDDVYTHVETIPEPKQIAEYIRVDAECGTIHNTMAIALPAPAGVVTGSSTERAANPRKTIHAAVMPVSARARGNDNHMKSSFQEILFKRVHEAQIAGISHLIQSPDGKILTARNEKLSSSTEYLSPIIAPGTQLGEPLNLSDVIFEKSKPELICDSDEVSESDVETEKPCDIAGTTMTEADSINFDCVDDLNIPSEGAAIRPEVLEVDLELLEDTDIGLAHDLTQWERLIGKFSRFKIRASKLTLRIRTKLNSRLDHLKQ